MTNLLDFVFSAPGVPVSRCPVHLSLTPEGRPLVTRGHRILGPLTAPGVRFLRLGLGKKPGRLNVLSRTRVLASARPTARARRRRPPSVQRYLQALFTRSG